MKQMIKSGDKARPLNLRPEKALKTNQNWGNTVSLKIYKSLIKFVIKLLLLSIVNFLKMKNLIIIILHLLLILFKITIYIIRLNGSLTMLRVDLPLPGFEFYCYWDIVAPIASHYMYAQSAR